MSNILIFFGLILLFSHEMDAIRRKEWKMFIFLKDLNEETGYRVFTFLHLPLYILLFWGLFIANETTAYYFALGLNIFYIIHLGLHLSFINNKNNEFKGLFSWVLLIGLAITGLVYIIVILRWKILLNQKK